MKIFDSPRCRNSPRTYVRQYDFRAVLAFRVLQGVGFGVLGSLYRSIITDLRAGLVGLSEAAGRLTSTLTPLAMGSAIALASPMFGFVFALRLAGLVLAVIAGGGSVLCLIVAGVSPRDSG